MNQQRRLTAAGLVLAAALLLIVPNTAQAQCVSGTMTAEMQMFGPLAGYWKYTLTITWDTPRGLSNVTLDNNFGFCPAAACAMTWLFDEISGEGTNAGEDGCSFTFSGDFNCNGNPSIGLSEPIIKWDVFPDGGCEGGQAGSATLSFYTEVPPQPAEVPVVILKNGRNQCEGEILGVAPMVCPTPVERSSWGQIKSLLSRDF